MTSKKPTDIKHISPEEKRRRGIEAGFRELGNSMQEDISNFTNKSSLKLAEGLSEVGTIAEKPFLPKQK